MRINEYSNGSMIQKTNKIKINKIIFLQQKINIKIKKRANHKLE